MTEKLFYEDSHMQEFSAVVQKCVPLEERFQVILDRTAFFPEGGGQYADTGKLEVLTDTKDSEIRKCVLVLDVQESDGEIRHITDQEILPGSRVQGTIAWEERFMKMQQHTGEHIVSGLIHAKFGYHNVGFHLGSQDCTMDFSGEITREKLSGIEQLANEAVVKNLEVQITYPSKSELETLHYRSKIEIEGETRIVTIPGVDVCACCAPHVSRTGEIGLIKLTHVQRYKGGARVTMLCGFRALADYDRKSAAARHISAALCAKEEEIAQAVDHLKDECAQWKQRLTEQQKEILKYKAEKIVPSKEAVCMFESGLEGDAPRELMNLVLEKGCLVCAVFSGNEQNGYRYVIGSRSLDMRKLVKEFHTAFAGRGGGKPEMVQGAVKGTEEELRVWIQEKVRRIKDE